MFNVSTNYNNHNDINSTKNKNTLKKIDYQKLLALALETNWKDTLNYTNPNDATNYLVDQITNITKKSEIPLAINSFKKRNCG